MKDFRSPLAKARDEYLQLHEGLTGPYSRNRLSLAFCAGWNAALSQPETKNVKMSLTVTRKRKKA